MLEIAGAVVTTDAMGCQRSIAAKIIEKKADYILALKGNQGTFREDVEVAQGPVQSSLYSPIAGNFGAN